MSVCVVCPSARPVEHVRAWAAMWRERGYHVAIMRDEPGFIAVKPNDLLQITTSPAGYSGYACAVNDLVLALLDIHPGAEWYAEWFIAAGDDTYPDPNHTAEEIARECQDHFYSRNAKNWDQIAERWDTFGVMQPTGDRWGEERRHHNPAMRGAYIDRVAGSAWIGREFARRVNQGKGPLWPEYFHMGCDEELQAVAVKLGVFWQRPDLTHYHDNWGRAKEGERYVPAERMPKFLHRAQSRAEWDRYKALFKVRRTAGFPGSELL